MDHYITNYFYNAVILQGFAKTREHQGRAHHCVGDDHIVAEIGQVLAGGIEGYARHLRNTLWG